MRNTTNERFAREFPGNKPPGRSTALAAIADLTVSTYTFATTSAEQQAADRDNIPHGGLHADYPTQMLLIDTHYLDVIGVDRMTGRYVPLQLTLLLDVFSRIVPAVIVTEISTDSFAVAQLLYRYFCPSARPDYMLPLGFLGVPTEIVADKDKAVFLEGRRPVAGALIPDNAKILIGKTQRTALVTMGTSLRPARVRTPTDKGPCERIFETIEEQVLANEPGYRGSSPAKRGVDIEQRAFRSVDEIEEMICEYLTDYHRSKHMGICLPDIPLKTFTPNAAHNLGVVRAFGRRGLSVPADPDAALRLLPVEWRVITHKGVKNKLYYKTDNGELPPPGTKSDLGSGKDRGKWPIRVNPWDRRYLYLERAPGEWITLTWVKAHYVDGPFTGRTLELALQLAETEPDVIDIVQAVNELLHRWGAGVADTPQERRAALEEIRRNYAATGELGSPETAMMDDEPDERYSPSDADIADPEYDAALEWRDAGQADDDLSDESHDYSGFYAHSAGTTADLARSTGRLRKHHDHPTTTLPQ